MACVETQPSEQLVDELPLAVDQPVHEDSLNSTDADTDLSVGCLVVLVHNGMGLLTVLALSKSIWISDNPHS